MPRPFVRYVPAALLLSLAVACSGGDQPGGEHLKNLKEGMTMDAALESMGKGPLTATYSDTVRVANGYRRMRYFINGADYQVVYARDLPGDVKEPLLQANETPIVFKDGKLIGFGWRYYVDEAIGKLGLPTPLRAADTLTVQKDTSAKGYAPGVIPPPPSQAAPAAPAGTPAPAADTTKKH
jgi:hypothetical protein